VFTWNLGGKVPAEEVDFSTVFASQRFKGVPDITVFGFQESITLGVKNIFKDLSNKKIKRVAKQILGIWN